MWTLRRASIHLRNQGLISGTARICCGKSEISRCCREKYNAESFEPQEKLFNRLLASPRFYTASSQSSKSYAEARAFSSQADAKSSGKDDDGLEDGFSELETPNDMALEAASGDENEDDMTSRLEFDEVGSELDAVGTKDNVGGKKPIATRGVSKMTKAILVAPNSSVAAALDKWVEAGNEVTQSEVSLAMHQLRRRRLFVKALQLSEWVQSKEYLEFGESTYASHVDLIAKVRGISTAEQYIEKIPESFRGEIVYRTLLANAVGVTNVKKSEAIFNKMKDLGFTRTTFACNQLLLLYKRIDRKKIADVLLLMEKENVKPSLFTYWILIDVKGQSGDISGMEQIVETMKSDGVEPNVQIQATLARHYVAAGLKEKAESLLKEMEGDDITKNRRACYLMLPIYASLGKEDEVERIWEVCKSNTQWHECLAVIEAWGKLDKVENAEAAFDQMLKKVKKPNSKHFTALLKVYANHKMLAKGKDLVKKMEEYGCTIGPLTWDALVKLYVGAGEVEKAASILEKGMTQNKGKMMFSSFLTIMDKYAERGDVHNTEKIFLMMRQAGYSSRLRLYQSLLQAYIKAKKPAYGFSDRMKADNVFPNKSLVSQLAKVDAFRKSAVADLLD